MTGTNPIRKVRNLLQSVIFVIGLLYVTILAGMYFMQRTLQYFPSNAHATPQDVGLQAEVISFKTSDGETLTAWHHKPRDGFPTILYFHGNGGGIATRPRKQAFLSGEGFGLMAVSYRGYMGSTGSPSEDGLMRDAVAAYEWLVASGVPAERILLLGESLGTGVAVQLAAKKPVKAVALEAPYANAVDVGAARYWFLPVRLLMKDQFRSGDYIGGLTAPVFITHGVLDSIIPIEQGRKLFALAKEPKQMVEFDDVGHDLISDERSWAKIAAFFLMHSPAVP